MLPKTIEELDAIRDECRKMVTRRAGLSAGVAVVPIPGLDLGADATLLMEMIPAINRSFGLTPEQIEQLDPQTKGITLVAITSISSEMVGKVVSKQVVMRILQKLGTRMVTKTATRFVPILGQVVAASMSFSAMKLVGDAHVDDCYEVARRALQEKAAARTKNPRTKKAKIPPQSQVEAKPKRTPKQKSRTANPS